MRLRVVIFGRRTSRDTAARSTEKKNCGGFTEVLTHLNDGRKSLKQTKPAADFSATFLLRVIVSSRTTQGLQKKKLNPLSVSFFFFNTNYRA